MTENQSDNSNMSNMEEDPQVDTELDQATMDDAGTEACDESSDNDGSGSDTIEEPTENADASDDAIDSESGDEADSSTLDEMPIPPATFELLVMTHASQAMLALGFMPDPTTGEMNKNLKLAGHHVDMLGLLDEKTKGNLTEAEGAMLENSLHQLRMAYVQAKSETA